MKFSDFWCLRLEFLRSRLETFEILSTQIFPKNKYLKKMAGSHQYCLDLSNEELSTAQQQELIRWLMTDNRKNPLTSFLANVKIQFKKNANIHPWLQKLEAVSSILHANEDVQEKRQAYLKAYLFKFRLVAIGVPAAVIMMVNLVGFGLLVAGILLPAAPIFVASIIAILFVVYWGDKYPMLFKNSIDKWVDRADDGAAEKFKNAISGYTFNPLGNEESINLGTVKLNTEANQFDSYQVILKQFQKEGKPNTVKLRLVRDEKEVGQELDHKGLHKTVMCSLSDKTPKLYFDRWAEMFQVETYGETVFVDPKSAVPSLAN